MTNSIRLWTHTPVEQIEIEMGIYEENEEPAPKSTIPAPHSAERAQVVHEYCKGLSFGAALATALYERGPL